MIDITFDEDTDIGDVVEILNMYHEGLFDETEQESLKTMMKSERVAYPRQLGDWITLTINGREKSVKCNCERCNFDGKCEYVATFDCLQFNKAPDAKCMLPSEGFDWNTKVK